MVQSEATVANRQQELIYVRNAAANAEDNLKALLGFNLPHEWQVKIEATDSYEMEPVLPDLQKSIETALEKRPSIIRQELELERLSHNVQVARNGALPQLNLTGSYGWSGVSGTSTITDPGTGEPVTIREGWGDAANQVFDFSYPRWTLGLNYSVPIGNHRAKEQLAATRYQRDRAGTQLAALKQSITHEVRVAVRSLYDGPWPTLSTPRSAPASTTARRWPGTTRSPAPTSSPSASRSKIPARPNRSTTTGRTPSGCSSPISTVRARTSASLLNRWRPQLINSDFGFRISDLPPALPRIKGGRLSFGVRTFPTNRPARETRAPQTETSDSASLWGSRPGCRGFGHATSWEISM
jgi:hypothetical protein